MNSHPPGSLTGRPRTPSAFVPCHSFVRSAIPFTRPCPVVCWCVNRERAPWARGVLDLVCLHALSSLRHPSRVKEGEGDGKGEQDRHGLLRTLRPHQTRRRHAGGRTHASVLEGRNNQREAEEGSRDQERARAARSSAGIPRSCSSVQTVQVWEILDLRSPLPAQRRGLLYREV